MGGGTGSDLRRSRVERLIEIARDMIRLGQALKLAGVASGGAGAKILIASGQVTVNGEPELRRGRQLHPGDVVHVGTDDLRMPDLLNPAMLRLATVLQRWVGRQRPDSRRACLQWFGRRSPTPRSRARQRCR